MCLLVSKMLDPLYFELYLVYLKEGLKTLKWFKLDLLHLKYIKLDWSELQLKRSLKTLK